VEAPDLFARLRVIGGDIAAHAIFTTAIADHDLVVEDARRAGDGVGCARNRIHFPDNRPVLRIKRKEPSVKARRIDAALPHGDTAIDHVAAAIAAPLARHFRVEAPQLFTRLAVNGNGDAPVEREIHDAIDNDRRGFEAARRISVRGPGKRQLADIFRSNLVERRETLLIISAAMGKPVAGLRIRIGDTLAVNADSAFDARGLDRPRRRIRAFRLCHRSRHFRRRLIAPDELPADESGQHQPRSGVNHYGPFLRLIRHDLPIPLMRRLNRLPGLSPRISSCGVALRLLRKLYPKAPQPQTMDNGARTPNTCGSFVQESSIARFLSRKWPTKRRARRRQRKTTMRISMLP